MSGAGRREAEVAASIAREAGRAAVAERARLSPVDVREKGPHDVVTRVDLLLEGLIRERLARAFPGDGFLGEESGGSAAAAGRQWVVDPLDGTANYVRGFPRFCVSIGLVEDGRPLAGAVFDPTLDEIFTGSPADGARLNGAPIRVTACDAAERAFLGTGFPSRYQREIDPYLAQFARVSRVAAGVRRAGSAALDLACVACGRFDGYWEPRLSPWDVAAGAAIVAAAGGTVTDLAGAPWRPGADGVAAAGPGLHPALLALLAAAA